MSIVETVLEARWRAAARYADGLAEAGAITDRPGRDRLRVTTSTSGTQQIALDTPAEYT